MTAKNQPKKPKSDRLNIRDQVYWHHYHLFRDAEFKREVTELLGPMVERYRAAGVPLYDTDTLRALGAGDEVVNGVTKLANKYGTSVERVIKFSTRYYTVAPIRPSGIIGSVRGNSIHLELPGDVTLADVQHMWPWVEELKQRLGHDPKRRVRTAENTQLIYCTHRARYRGLTFGQIFDQYERGELPGYTGSTTQFLTSKLLENYFHKHKFY